MDEQTLHNLDEEQGSAPNERRGVSRRDVLYGVLGLIAGLLVLSGVWFAAKGKDAAPDLSKFTEINRPAADFELQTLNGNTVKLSDYRGKLVLLNFWRTDCVPCQDETPALQAAYEQLRGQDVEIIGMNMFRDEQLNKVGVDQVRQFATLYGVSYPIALDADGSVTQKYLVGNIPVSYLIDANGNARFVHIGEVTTADVVALVQELKGRDAAAAQAQ
jgi:peroxiredoxin